MEAYMKKRNRSKSKSKCSYREFNKMKTDSSNLMTNRALINQI